MVGAVMLCITKVDSFASQGAFFSKEDLHSHRVREQKKVTCGRWYAALNKIQYALTHSRSHIKLLRKNLRRHHLSHSHLGPSGPK